MIREKTTTLYRPMGQPAGKFEFQTFKPFKPFKTF